jgi:hypothetical protein
MSSSSNKRQAAGRGPGAAPPPGARSTRNVSLFLLVFVDFVVAAMMVVMSASFLIRPDPAVKAGPMYVVLALTTVAALLMFFLALNASFLPFLTPQQARDARLVMWVMGATGIVTGILTVGAEAQGIVTRLFVGSIAFIFIRVQESRLERARTSGPPKQALPAVQKTAPPSKGRQRRGGRKR